MNYETPELTAQLVFSLLRVLRTGALDRIVVVESSEQPHPEGVLAGLRDAGLVTIVRRTGRPYHGPGLNDGMSYLAAEQGARPVDLVWVLDSDVVVLRPDALDRLVRGLREARAVLAGEVRAPHERTWPEGVVVPAHARSDQLWQPHWRPPQSPEPPDRYWPYVHVSSLLMDPAVVWQSDLPAFREDGEPGIAMQESLHQAGHRIADVPVYRESRLLHLGRGTSFAVRDLGRWRNRYYRWSRNEHSHHYEGNPDGVFLHAAFARRYRDEVSNADPGSVVAACLRPERLEFRVR